MQEEEPNVGHNDCVQVDNFVRLLAPLDLGNILALFKLQLAEISPLAGVFLVLENLHHSTRVHSETRDEVDVEKEFAHRLSLPDRHGEEA